MEPTTSKDNQEPEEVVILFDDESSDSHEELTENEVDLLMDALDDDDSDDLEQNKDQELDSEQNPSNNAMFRYSFSLPTVALDAADDVNGQDDEEQPQPQEGQDDQDEDAAIEDTETEPASEYASATTDLSSKAKRSKRTFGKMGETDSASAESSSAEVSKSPKVVAQDEWNEARAVSHLLSSPYDASFGLLSRVETR